MAKSYGIIKRKQIQTNIYLLKIIYLIGQK